MAVLEWKKPAALAHCGLLDVLVALQGRQPGKSSEDPRAREINDLGCATNAGAVVRGVDPKRIPAASAEATLPTHASARPRARSKRHCRLCCRDTCRSLCLARRQQSLQSSRRRHQPSLRSKRLAKAAPDPRAAHPASPIGRRLAHTGRHSDQRLSIISGGKASCLAKMAAISLACSVPQVHRGTMASARLRPSGGSA